MQMYSGHRRRGCKRLWLNDNCSCSCTHACIYNIYLYMCVCSRYMCVGITSQEENGFLKLSHYTGRRYLVQSLFGVVFVYYVYTYI